MAIKKNINQLPKDVQELCHESLAARKNAYAPYSNFFVGAAIRTINGNIITGCNVENASYGLAICAERTACVKAVSQVINRLKLNILSTLNISEIFRELQASKLLPSLPI